VTEPAKDRIVETDGVPEHTSSETLPKLVPKGQVEEYWKDPTPLFYLDTWDLAAFSGGDITKIKAGLLTIHAAFLENRLGEDELIECWRRAFDVFAITFFERGVLCESVMRDAIPMMVMDATASAMWGAAKHGTPVPVRGCSAKFGNEYYPEGFIAEYFFRRVDGRILDWRGRLLLARLAEPTPNRQNLTKPGRRGRPRIHPNAHVEVDQRITEITKFARSDANPIIKLRREITLHDFSLVSGYADDTTLTYYRQGSPRCSEAQSARFKHTLELSPAQFIQKLAALKGIS